MDWQQALISARQKISAGQYAEAESIYRRLIGNQPNCAEAHNDLGNLLCAMGRHEEALAYYQRALAAQPKYFDAYINLGNALRALKRSDQAATAYQKALQLDPLNVIAITNLGTAFYDQWRLKEAIACYTQAMSVKPDYVPAYYNLGTALEGLGNREGAAAAYEKAIRLDPRMAGPHCNLGGILMTAGRVDEALGLCRKAIELNPRFAEAHGNLGNALWLSGRSDLAVDSYRRAAELAPNNPAFVNNISFISYFDPRATIDTVRRANELWNMRFAEPQKAFIRPNDNDRSPERRLRIGYIFPHNHDHPCFMPPLLRNHDSQKFEIYCYTYLAAGDTGSLRLQQPAHQWRTIRGMSDADFAAQVRGDRIDILVDLVLHMNGSRLVALARKPAPIQVAYLAYPGTTGLSAMDYRFTDGFVDPPGMFDDCYTETSIRLPRTFACYDQAETGTADQTGLERKKADLTFGSLNNFSKVNEPVLDLWARVLNALPQSRLRLLAPSREGRNFVIAHLARHGVEASRLDFVPKQNRPNYLAEFHQIDVCLDTLPYCGHTTTLDALWMGVPVVTRVGSTAAGRVGWSVYNNLNLTELAAENDEQFVRIAVELANDQARRSELKRTLRRRLQDSPVMDGPAFARDIEAAYRDFWRRWIGG